MGSLVPSLRPPHPHRAGNIARGLADKSLRAETQIPVLRLDGLTGDTHDVHARTDRGMVSALRALPAMDSSKRRLTKQAVVKRLAREIAALQTRGYTIEQIVECLQASDSRSPRRR